MKASPLTLLLVLCLLASGAALILGFMVAASVWFIAAGFTFTRLQKGDTHQPRPTITYLPAPLPHEPFIQLRRGQTASVPWPPPLQILLYEGTRLQILEATPERVRVMAV